jgi:twitching motility protein PilT
MASVSAEHERATGARLGLVSPGPIAVEFTMWLRELASGAGSDLHLKVDSPPMIREQGELRRLERAPLSNGELEELAEAIIPHRRRDLFEREGEVDFAHSLLGVGRFRANVFRQRTSVSMVLRKLGTGGPTFAEIGLPSIVQDLAEEKRGLVLVTGPTGSGKTTTLAAMIEHINSTRRVHIVTIEDPIEVMHEDKLSSINQREIGQDSTTFFKALRAALRQDPDVILIGEMRDAETVQAALQAAETGHLVFSTLHTVDATETINRLVDFFPATQQQQARFTLAGALRGIVCQRLVPAVGGGRIPGLEVLVNTGRIAERIIDPAKTSEIKDVLVEGGYYGMRTFDQSLVELVSLGDVAVEDAMAVASVPQDLKIMLDQAAVQAARLSFETDIKPIFSPQDKLELAWAFDLSDASSVEEHAADILERLRSGDIVPAEGASADAIAVFETWFANPLP